VSGLEGCDDWGEYLTVAALVGLGSRGKTGKKIILLSGQNVGNIQNLFRSKTVLQKRSVTSVWQGLL